MSALTREEIATLRKRGEYHLADIDPEWQEIGRVYLLLLDAYEDLTAKLQAAEARVKELEAQQEEWIQVNLAHVKGTSDANVARDKARAGAERLAEALDRIKSNANAWHHNNDAKARALAVIAGWAEEALAAYQEQGGG